MKRLHFMSNRTIPMKNHEKNSGETSYAADFDALTRSQYYDRRAPARHLDGETRLLFAVLEDAIRCVLLYRPSPNYVKRRELSEAIAWVNTRGDHDLFSFDSICEVFEIEPETLRRQLNSMSARSEDPPHAESNNLAIPSPRTVKRAAVEDLCGVVSRRPVNVAAHDSTTVHAPFSCYLLEVE